MKKLTKVYKNIKKLLLLSIPSTLIMGMGTTTASAIDISLLGRYTSSVGSEISSFDPVTGRLFTVTGGNDMQILNLTNPSNPVLFNTLDLSSFGAANSVAVKNGIVAVAIQNSTVTNPGTVAFFDTNGSFLNSVTVGALPDMLTFTPDGLKILVANEAEPRPGVDPVGSVSIIDLTGGVGSATVATAGFDGFNSQLASLKAAGVRLFPGKTVAEDVEPEYIGISSDSSTAWVSLQENNALARVDIGSATVTDILPLNTKNHNLPGNGLDPSDRDGGININNWPVLGMYMPDAVATIEVNGQTYILSANEGDSRGEDARISSLTLDPTAFPNAATLQQQANIGRLEVSTIDGDIDGDGDYDQLYAYGARSFSIWSGIGALVYDSGDALEQITALQVPSFFNSSNGLAADFDTRSDSKGPEPEGIAVGKLGDIWYSFVGLERTGGFVAYNLSDPSNPVFTNYVFPGDPNAASTTDVAPEGLLFIPAANSPNGKALLVVSNEVSRTTTIYSVSVPEPSSVLGLFLVGGGLVAAKFKKKIS